MNKVKNLFCFFQVLYNFQAQIDGDLSVAEGEVVRIKEQHNADWVSVCCFFEAENFLFILLLIGNSRLLIDIVMSQFYS